MPHVDTHCHVGPSWYEPVEAVRYHMDANGVDHAVLVQHNGMFDNDYLLEQVRSSPDRFSGIVQIDPEDPAPSRTLKTLVDAGASGLRLPLHTPIANAEFDELWTVADDLGLLVSVQGQRPGDFVSDRFVRIVESAPGATFLLEHLLGLATVEPPYDETTAEFEAALDLAARSNVY